MRTNITDQQQTLVKPVICNGLRDIPNSWGHQRYEGEYLKLVVDTQRDINNNLAQNGTLRDFVIRHVEGIKLKTKPKVDFCKNCTCQ